MPDSIFKQMGSAVKTLVDTTKAELQAEIAAVAASVGSGGGSVNPGSFAGFTRDVNGTQVPYDPETDLLLSTSTNWYNIDPDQGVGTLSVHSVDGSDRLVQGGGGTSEFFIGALNNNQLIFGSEAVDPNVDRSYMFFWPRNTANTPLPVSTSTPIPSDKVGTSIELAEFVNYERKNGAPYANRQWQTFYNPGMSSYFNAIETSTIADYIVEWNNKQQYFGSYTYFGTDNQYSNAYMSAAWISADFDIPAEGITVTVVTAADGEGVQQMTITASNISETVGNIYTGVHQSNITVFLRPETSDGIQCYINSIQPDSIATFYFEKRQLTMDVAVNPINGVNAFRISTTNPNYMAGWNWNEYGFANGWFAADPANNTLWETTDTNPAMGNYSEGSRDEGYVSLWDASSGTLVKTDHEYWREDEVYNSDVVRLTDTRFAVVDGDEDVPADDWVSNVRIFDVVSGEITKVGDTYYTNYDAVQDVMRVSATQLVCSGEYDRNSDLPHSTFPWFDEPLSFWGQTYDMPGAGVDHNVLTLVNVATDGTPTVVDCVFTQYPNSMQLSSLPIGMSVVDASSWQGNYYTRGNSRLINLGNSRFVSVAVWEVGGFPQDFEVNPAYADQKNWMNSKNLKIRKNGYYIIAEVFAIENNSFVRKGEAQILEQYISQNHNFEGVEVPGWIIYGNIDSYPDNNTDVFSTADTPSQFLFTTKQNLSYSHAGGSFNPGETRKLFRCDVNSAGVVTVLDKSDLVVDNTSYGYLAGIRPAPGQFLFFSVVQADPTKLKIHRCRVNADNMLEFNTTVQMTLPTTFNGDSLAVVNFGPGKVVLHWESTVPNQGDPDTRETHMAILSLN